jgi:DNA-binding winged-HTH domains
MEQEPFYINNRFFTNPSTNTIKEIKGADEIHLEPRLMKLLCLLSSNEGKVVSREFLIKEIWNDYGGADEGLTQAISFLRKVIGDKKKNIIETVPKNGYILHAIISRHMNEESIKVDEPKRTYHRYLLAPIILVILLSGYFIFEKSASKPKLKPLQSNSNADINKNTIDSIKADFPDLSKGEEENYLNSISTVDSQGVKYRLVMIGDRRPKFYINGQLFTKDIPGKYTLLIDKLSKELWERQARAKAKTK